MDDPLRPGSSGSAGRRPNAPSQTIPRKPVASFAADSRMSGAPSSNASAAQAYPRPPPPPMRIRRLPSTPLITRGSSQLQVPSLEPSGDAGRRRSLSAPQNPKRPASASSGDDARAGKHTVANQSLSPLAEEGLAATSSPPHSNQPLAPVNRSRAPSDAASDAVEYVLGRKRRSTSTTRPLAAPVDYENDVVDLLDVIDPEVSTLSTLNNVQNSLFIPNLGRFLNRLPTYDLSIRDNRPPLSRIPTVDETKELEMKQSREPKQHELDTADDDGRASPSIFGAPLAHSHSISSNLSQSNYAVLPHGVVLEGWSEIDKAELNDHVRHLLHSKKAGFKRSMKGFGKYVRTPLGAFVTIYAFLITFWGATWVLFIIGWLSIGGRQAYFIEICDQILTALFCVVGIGMAPFRAVDTYHMIYIAKYHYKTLRLRRERALPPLPDPNDLPEPHQDHDVEAAKAGDLTEDLVLSPEEQRLYEKHRAKFTKSHTFYKPHETYTHYAFGIDLMITAVVLLDFHSIFQMALGGTTWGINYHVRPKAVTAVILTCSICCNISAGLVISIGGKKTRKKEVVERLFRQALTEEALTKLEKKKGLHPTSKDDALAHEVLRSKQEAAEYERVRQQETATVAQMFKP